MNCGDSTSRSALRALEIKQGVTANNLANLSTPGFKARRVSLEEQVQGGSGNGVKVSATPADFRSGGRSSTDRELDLSIQGPGFFAVQLGNGAQGLTRDGSFQVSSDGTVTTAGGQTVIGFPPVPAGTTSIEVSPSGAGTFLNPTGDVNFQVPVAQVPNPQGLDNLGGNLFGVTAASGAPEFGNAAPIVRGSLELSNVDLPTEMVNLIDVKQAYQANLAVLRASDQMGQELQDLVRRS